MIPLELWGRSRAIIEAKKLRRSPFLVGVHPIQNRFYRSMSARRVRTYGLCLLFALLLHFLGYYSLHPLIQISPGAARNIAAVRIISVPKATPANAAVNTDLRPGSSRKVASVQLTPVPQYPVGKPGYQRLLPSLARDYGDSPSDSQMDGPAALGEKLAPRMQGHGAIIASEIDLPLHWRKNAKASFATASLEIRDGGEVWCRLLSGDPMLRAVLWRYLQKPSVYEALAQILRATDRQDYQIRLRFIPEDGPERTTNLAEDSATYSRGIEIVKTLPTPGRSFGGMAVSDEDSRKAILRDRLALGDLYESPAFRHQIRDVKLGRL